MKNSLLQLLTLNIAQPSISAILGRMQTLSDFCVQQANFRTILPFLHTYFLITKTVALKRVDGSKTFTHLEDL